MSTERDLQDEIERVLVALAIPYDRERRFGREDRPDFYLTKSRWAIEVKLAYPAGKTIRQIARYMVHPEIDGVALIAPRSVSLPPVLEGKPTTEIELWKAMML